MRQGTTECWSRVFFLAPGQSGPDKSQGGSVQISCLVVSDSLWPHGLQHTRLPYASQLLELAQTHVPWVGNGIQPSHPLSSPSPPAFNLSSIRVFSIESALHNRWPKYWSFSFSLVLPMYIQDWFPLGWTYWISLQSKRPSRVFNTTVQKYQFFDTQFSLYSNSHIHTWPLEKP